MKSSELGQGSTFEISISIGEPTSDSLKLNKPATLPRARLNGLRVLVVDDSKDNQTLITHFLKLAHVSVETANDGLEAIERVNRDAFDVVLMDVQMPRLGGHEAVARLREQGYKKPVIALTAHAFREDRDRALAAGYDDYLTKPIDRNRLIETLGRFAR